MGTEVAKSGSAVPALADTPSLDLGVEDIAFSRLYVGNALSKHVERGDVEKGALYLALDQDDPEPVLLSDGNEPVRVHVLALRRGKSTSIDGELQRYDFNDPDAPANAWTTYNYVVALPQVAKDTLFKVLLTRSAQPTAKRINTILVRSGKPPFETAFDLTTAPRQNAKGRWFVAEARHVEADAEDLAVAEALSSLVPTDVETAATPEVEPDI